MSKSTYIEYRKISWGEEVAQHAGIEYRPEHD